MSDDLEDLNRALDGVIQRACADAGTTVTKWVLVAEGIEQDGQRSLGAFCSPGVTGWDTIGMLDHQIAREHALIAQQFNEEDQ